MAASPATSAPTPATLPTESARVARPRHQRRRRLDVAAVAVGLLATIATLLRLFVPSTIGIADNGDFGRLFCHVQAVQPEQFMVNRYVPLVYNRGSYRFCREHSPAEVPVWVGSQISRHLPTSHQLDLRVLAVLYAVAFGVAVGALVWALPGRWWLRALGGVVLVALMDVAFVAYFASGYREPIALIGLIGCLALLMHLWQRPRRPLLTLAGATLAGSVVVTAKPQFALVAVPIAVGLVVAPLVSKRSQSRRVMERLAGFVAAVVVVVAAVFTVHATPTSVNRDDQFHALFTELLAHSPNPEADLRELGLPTGLVRWIYAPYYENPMVNRDPQLKLVWKRITPFRLSAFYAAHPSRARALAERGFDQAAVLRPGYLGNYPMSAGKPAYAQACRFCPTVGIAGAIRPHARWVLPCLWLLALALGVFDVITGDNDRRVIGGALVFSATTTALLFYVAIVGEGAYELAKHLYLADAAGVLTATLAIVAIGELVDGVIRSGKPRRAYERMVTARSREP